MAARTFTVDIVTPDRVVLSQEATSLVAPGVKGSFGILPGHAPLLSELEPGELRFRRDNGQEVRLAVAGGFLQVFNNRVTVLADNAQRAEEIDVENERLAIERARQEIRDATARFDEDARQQAELELTRAQNRIRVAAG